ncbi:microfibril-associated glycoprotein 4-like isoform X3 [Wyeomyia smithii]|uniref:microfibril-associated glycoprotein 4-like isoform X3 n=1 Tax=Wyeomyia smithii TaxID=174621 RepID=UPI00246808F4|nr:microfibril-associated glycoprotein 4-like isoform X3 [Wyeomyia smithii]
MTQSSLWFILTLLSTIAICGSSSTADFVGTEQCGFGMELILTKLEQLELKMALLEEHLTNFMTTKRTKVESGEEPVETTTISTSSETFESCSKVPSGASKQWLLKPTEASQPFNALCETNSYGKGWMIIQHRFNGSENFYRNWTEYKNGFGSLNGEFWFGLDRIHLFTTNKRHEILFEFADFSQEKRNAKYSVFRIGSEAEQYVLAELGAYTGTGGDGLEGHRGMKFSTFDRDNDIYIDSCAKLAHGAWWYYQCFRSNLNGKYTRDRGGYEAMSWNTFHRDGNLQWCKIMIREI